MRKKYSWRSFKIIPKIKDKSLIDYAEVRWGEGPSKKSYLTRKKLNGYV